MDSRESHISKRRSFSANTGRKGEQQACEYLQGLGHVILERNYRASHREIDIISLSEGNILHIVEVKSRTEPVTAAPELNVNRNKQRNLAAAASAYLNSQDKFASADMEVVFDVITVVFSPSGTKIEYYPQAYIPTYVR